MRYAFIFLIAIGMSTQAYSATQRFEAFGDSITAAAMAAIPLAKKAKEPTTELEISMCADPASHENEDQNLTDEQVTDLDTDETYWAWFVRKFYTFFANSTSFPSYSWAGGTKIDSVHKFLKDEWGYKELEFKLQAVSGSTTKDFLDQIKDSRAEQKKKGHELALASVLVGANNYCFDYDIEEGADELMRGLDALLEDTKTKVVFVQIPDANMLRPLADKTILNGKLTCETLWNWSGFYCNKVLGIDEETSRKNVKKWRDRWSEIAAEYKEKYPERFFTVSFDGEVSAERIAADCFHPSAYGQELISGHIIRQTII